VKKVTTPVGRLSFPSLFTPTSFSEEQEKKFECTLLFPKDSADLSKMKALAADAVQEKFGDKVPRILRNPFRDGDEKDLDGYAGHWYVKFSSAKRPRLYDLALSEIIDPDEIYAGCYVRVSASVYAYSKAGNNGVAFGLLGVQKVKDGSAFGTVFKAEEDFFDSAEVAKSVGATDFNFGVNEDDPLNF
jgi:hypothetical protein